MKYKKFGMNYTNHPSNIKKQALELCCSGCGNTLTGIENFCPSCGKKLEHIRKEIAEDMIIDILNRSDIKEQFIIKNSKESN